MSPNIKSEESCSGVRPTFSAKGLRLEFAMPWVLPRIFPSRRISAHEGCVFRVTVDDTRVRVISIALAFLDGEFYALLHRLIARLGVGDGVGAGWDIAGRGNPGARFPIEEQDAVLGNNRKLDLGELGSTKSVESRLETCHW
jgi:hypothetical protein